MRLGLLRANLPADKYAGHSFWIGAATTAASAGIEDSTIQTLGRWLSSSYVFTVHSAGSPSHGIIIIHSSQMFNLSSQLNLRLS